MVLEFFEYFFDFFLCILDFLDFFLFLDSLIFFKFVIFFSFFEIPFKVSKVTKSYQGYYWAPKIVKNGPKQHNNLSFFARRGKKATAKG